jgi:hypothetical protein
MKLLSVSVVTLLALSFGGCGGGSSSSDGDTNGETSSGGTNDGGTSSGGTNNGGSSSLTPITPFTCESTLGGATFKLGADGSLACEMSYGVPVLTFANGNGMDISQLVSVTKITTIYGNGTYTIDVEHGTETIVASSPEYGSANCVNTYDIPTPISVYEASDLEHFDISVYQLIRTTCPDWVNDDYDYDTDDDDETDVSGSFTENVTVTETSGKVSKISSYTSF